MNVRNTRWNRSFATAAIFFVLAVLAPALASPILHMLPNDYTPASGALSSPRIVGSLVLGIIDCILAVTAFLISIRHYLRVRKSPTENPKRYATTASAVLTAVTGLFALFLCVRFIWTIFWVLAINASTFSF